MGIIKGRMEVKLFGAKGLKNTDFFGRVDTYVLLQYRDQECKSSIAKPKNIPKSCIPCIHCGAQGSIVWNEIFEFRVDYPSTDDDINVINHQQKLVLKIMDRDTYTEHDYLGQATIYVKELIEIGAEKGKAEHRPQKYRVVSNSKAYHGEVQVGITFIANKEIDKEEDYGGWKESDLANL